MKGKQEYIICAANFYDDNVERTSRPTNIKTGFVTCGHRHHNCIGTFAEIYGFPYNEKALEIRNTEEQGFMTSKNRFVDRKEAGIIAYNAKQTETLIERLHSEDLY